SGRQMPRQVLAEAIADEGRVRVLLLEPRPLRTVADGDLAAGPGHVQESVDMLLDGDAAHIGGDRTRQSEEMLRVRLEYLGIHAPAPGGQVPEATRRQIEAHRGRAHHAA